jgi:hypothetical protein
VAKQIKEKYIQRVMWMKLFSVTDLRSVLHFLPIMLWYWIWGLESDPRYVVKGNIFFKAVKVMTSGTLAAILQSQEQEVNKLPV